MIGPDLTLSWNASAMLADLVRDGQDLATDGGLRSAVLISLFTNRRADEGDALPAGETDRRGWWGDSFPVVAGDKIGSRLWLRARGKQTPDLLEQVTADVREALAWLLDDGVASAVDVVAAYVLTPRALTLEINIQRPGVDPTSYRFGRTWEDL